MPDYAAWLKRSDAERVFLVETQARRLSDGALIPVYLADRGIVLNARAYLGCALDLPRLTRQSNDTLDPNHVPTWGELSVARDPRVRPDAYNTLSWEELLSPDYSFAGQPLVIKLGDPAWTHEQFLTIFSGRIDNPSWGDDRVTFVIFDKAQDLEANKAPGYVLPESSRVIEESWGQSVPVVLGTAKNYEPVLITLNAPEPYDVKYALACHVVNDMLAAYADNIVFTTPWIQKDVFPAAKKGSGAAVMDTFGPYTADLVKAEWLVEIDSVTRLNDRGQSGPEVGLASFSWYLNGVLMGSGILSWKLAPGDVTKNPALGGSVLTLGGEFTGETKRQERIKITQTGNFSTPGKFILSEDGGASWGPEVEITSADPIALGNGLTASFSGATRMGAVTKTATGTGDITVGGTYAGSALIRNYRVQITTAGDTGSAAWKWSDNGGSSWTGPISGLPTSPFSLSYGVTVFFSAGDYEVDDAWEWTAYPPFVADDVWAFTFIEVPVPLADGVSVQFTGGDGEDFALGDEFRFILGSTLIKASYESGEKITVDVEGLPLPDGTFEGNLGEMVRALLCAELGWDWQADFDLAALAAFKAALPYAGGLAVDSPTEISQIISDILAGVPALFTIDREGKFFLKEVTRPAGDPVLELDEAVILGNPEGRDNTDNLCQRVYLRYDYNPNVVEDPKGLPVAREEWLRKEWRQASDWDRTVRDDFPTARDLGPLETALIDRADAQAAAGKNLVLYQAPLKRYSMESPDLRAVLLNLGDATRVRGNLYRVDGLDLDFTRKVATLEVWQ